MQHAASALNPLAWLHMAWHLPHSAVGGLEALQEWLRARLFLTNYRPVPLTEHAVFQGTVFQKVGELSGQASASARNAL